MGILELEFQPAGSLAAARAFFAQVVKTLWPDVSGEWSQVKHEPAPGAPELGRHEFMLGPATLVQVLSAGYLVEFDLRILGAPGAPRRLSHWSSSAQPVPQRFALRLEGVTPEEFLALRELGRAHFPEDRTADAAHAVVNARELLTRGAFPLARSLVEEALDRPQAEVPAAVGEELEALRRRFGLAVMHLSFRSEASLVAVRDFLADAVQRVCPERSGPWVVAKTTPRPHPALGSGPELAVIEYALGDARLVQSVVGAEGGDPREGHGYELRFDLTLPGPDGAVRTALLKDANWSPFPRAVHFELDRFTAAEFADLRTAARARFGNDESDHCVWAVSNVKQLVRLGDRAAALELVDASLALPQQAAYVSATRELRWLRARLSDEPTAQAAAEAEALRADPVNPLLEEVAQGRRVLPGWTASAARRIDAQLRPWRAESIALLGAASPTWLDHPWWSPSTGQSLEGWRALESQPGSGAPEPLELWAAVRALRFALGVQDVDTRGLPHVMTDGRVLGLHEDAVQLQAVTHHRAEKDGFAYWWTWVWAGALNGAVLLVRVSFDEEQRGTRKPTHTQLAWLGAPEFAKRFEEKLRADDPKVVLSPARVL